MTYIDLDMIEFQRLSDYEESVPDYKISSEFPKIPEENLRHLIDYRIKLLLKDEVTLNPSESELVPTACKICKNRPKLAMHLKAYEHLPVTFESDGFICQKYIGVISVKLTNYTNTTIKLAPGTVLGYVVLQPFALE